VEQRGALQERLPERRRRGKAESLTEFLAPGGKVEGKILREMGDGTTGSINNSMKYKFLISTE